MDTTFKGFLREDGSVGTRNYIGVISSVICSSVVTRAIADAVPMAVPITHTNGCGQLGEDFLVTKNMLSGISRNSNIYGALLVGLGCETNQVSNLLKTIPHTKPIEGFTIQELAGGKNTVERGVSIAKKWSNEANAIDRETFSLSQLKVGVITKGLDGEALQTLQPVIGKVVDLLLANGATVLWGLNNSLEPAGKELAQKVSDPILKEALTGLSKSLARRRWDEEKEHLPVDYSEESHHQAIEEAKLLGNHDIKDLLYYNERPEKAGLYLIKSSDNIVETLSNFVSAGCNLSLVIAKEEVLTGSSVIPSMIVTASTATVEEGAHHGFIDFEVDPDGKDQAQALYKKLLQISSGEKTKLEEYELGDFAIPHVGTTF